MSLKFPLFAKSLVVAGSAVFLAVAPIAAAQDGDPTGGSTTPGQTIGDLTNQGYDVHINWVDGTPDVVPLSQCTVTDVNTAAAPKAYVSISCPPAGSQ